MSFLVYFAVATIIGLISLLIWTSTQNSNTPSPTTKTLSANATIIQSIILGRHPNCPTLALDAATWMDSLGVLAIATGQSCPTGTSTTAPQNWSLSSGNGYFACYPSNLPSNFPSNVQADITACT